MEIAKIDNAAELRAVAYIAPLSPQERAQQQQLVRAVESVNLSKTFGQGTELTFAFDRRSRSPIVRLIDVETKEVIRQIPAEVVLQLAGENEKL